MALTLTLVGNTSTLAAEYFPPLELAGDYVCGLVDFQTYNSIPNIDERNNLFHYGDGKVIAIPTGSYEIDDISNYLQKELGSSLILKANNNTLKCEIKGLFNINFEKERSIGSLLGFTKRTLQPNIVHVSDIPVNIIKVNTIRIECNIIDGSYINNTKVHTLHEFAPTVGPGYKIVEVPKNVIYLPVKVKRITTITLKLLDQDGDIINFRSENITVRLHLKNASIQ